MCRQDGGAEDAELGHCMEKLGVKTANTSDAMGRSRFHCFAPDVFLAVPRRYPKWYLRYDALGAQSVSEVP